MESPLGRPEALQALSQAPTETRNMLTGPKLLTAYVDGMAARGELLPGGKDAVHRLIESDRYRNTPEKALASLVGDFASSPAATPSLLNDPHGRRTNPTGGGVASRYRNPEHKPTETEAPLRAILRRLEAGGWLGRGQADRAYERFAVDLAGETDPAKLAEAVARSVALPDNEDLLAVLPALSETAQAVDEALRPYASQLRLGAVTRDLLRLWGHELGYPLRDIPHKVAQRLTQPIHARNLTRDGQPLEIDVVALRMQHAAARQAESLQPAAVLSVL